MPTLTVYPVPNWGSNASGSTVRTSYYKNYFGTITRTNLTAKFNLSSLPTYSRINNFSFKIYCTSSDSNYHCNPSYCTIYYPSTYTTISFYLNGSSSSMVTTASPFSPGLVGATYVSPSTFQTSKPSDYITCSGICDFLGINPSSKTYYYGGTFDLNQFYLTIDYTVIRKKRLNNLFSLAGV